jgi:hypothetical protein
MGSAGLTQSMVEAALEDLPELLDAEADLNGFEDDAVQLVMEYQLHGWTGRVSANHHVILRSPDGTATAAVQRKFKRNRGGQNARRPLNQWLQKRERERERKRSNAFGVAPAEDAPPPAGSKPPWQIATKQSYDARLRMQKMTRDWWDGIVAAGSGVMSWHLDEGGEDDWILADAKRESKEVRVVASGPATDPARVAGVEMLVALAVDHFKPKEKHPMSEAGPQTTGEQLPYPCLEPGCGASFGTQGALNLHSTKHDKTEYPCPLCDRVMPTPAALGRHVHSKLHADDPRLAHVVRRMDGGKKNRRLPARACEYCGKMFPAVSIGGHHRGHKAAGDVKIGHGGGTTQAKATTAPETPVAAQAVTAPPASPEPLVVQALPTAVSEPAAVNGTGHATQPSDLLNQVRALVNPELVGDLERLRKECDELLAELEAVTKERNELKAWKDMMREAMDA